MRWPMAKRQLDEKWVRGSATQGGCDTTEEACGDTKTTPCVCRGGGTPRRTYETIGFLKLVVPACTALVVEGRGLGVQMAKRIQFGWSWATRAPAAGAWNTCISKPRNYVFYGGVCAIQTVLLDLRVCCFYLKHCHCFMCGAALFLGQAHPHQPRACLCVCVVFKAICFKMLCHGIERQRLNSS